MGGLLALAAVTGCGPAGTGVVAAPPPSAAPPSPSPPADPILREGRLVADWESGAQGLGEPARTAPGFAPPAVVDAVRQVRAVLAAGNLDPAVLTGGDMEPLLATDPARAENWFATTLSGASGPRDPLTLATRFLPGTATLIDSPRVRGAFTARSEPGATGLELLVTWAGTLVYPLRDAAGETGLVAVEREITWRFAPDGDYLAFPLGYRHDARLVGVQVCTGASPGWLRPDLGSVTELYPEDVDGLDNDGDDPAGSDTDRFTADC